MNSTFNLISQSLPLSYFLPQIIKTFLNSMAAAEEAVSLTQSKASQADEDKFLVSQTQNGDSKAFDNLIRKYHPRLYGLIFHMTSNHEDTNDLLQDVFAKAYRSINHFHGKSSFYTWIYRIAVNMTLNFIKKQRRHYFTSINDDNNPIENDPEFIDAAKNKNNLDPVALMNNQELQKKLTKAMLQLSAQHRAVVTLFDIQGIPQAEIAKILKTTEGTIRSRLFYAHRQLQNFLREFMVK
ncbi:MAG: sigma-70 family RNA polymerase sigma factor [Verrucomicrobiae bacterium]|jgi:RNA polymerase sigma-70 factor (ECF subfamily)|nr:sigma-70 family RNA polymerase sigma factor [Verrucomicrobiae bacterium]